MEFKALKFEVGVVNEVTLAFDEPRITPSKKYPGKNMIWYGIKETIGGENGFNASESLHAMIGKSGAKKGDMIEIKKNAGDKFAYFTVNGKSMDDFNNEVHPSPQESVSKVAASFAPTAPGVEYKNKPGEISLEMKVEKMWTKFVKDNPDEDIPF